MATILYLEISSLERSNGEGKSERTSEESKETQIHKIVDPLERTHGGATRSIDWKLIVNPDGLRNQRNSEQVNACSVWSRKHNESQICWRLLSADSSSLYPINWFSLSLPHFKFVSSLLNKISSTSLLLKTTSISRGKPPRPLATWIAIRDSLVDVIAVVKAAGLMLDDGFCL
ncbi:unnamed protein product [Linum tenue]|uniref:Uncharacterized protein n=1 Tax=Linum tenue TaxID=586396 RepID=A0AAV0J1G6_9ROSI|nr:unnamed protein product [Linum tenue]